MERSTNNCLYLDYNATSPLANSVKHWITSGDLFLGNASSTHQLGRKSLKLINDTKAYLYNLFGVSEKEYSIVFHSGATEGINLFFKSLVTDGVYACSAIDHSVSHELLDFFKTKNIGSIELPIKANGDVDYSPLNELQKIFLNASLVHGETGGKARVDQLLELKDKLNIVIHLDCAQLVGKTLDWKHLPQGFDGYTFSGHKFGALKGVGFSFLNKKLSFSTWIHGGGQQGTLRSGTMNEIGIYSLKLALEDFSTHFDAERAQEVSHFTQSRLAMIFKEKITFVNTNIDRALNTFLFILDGIKSDQFLSAMDLSGVCMSAGPACSSGVVKESRTLKALGFAIEKHKSSIRLSFNPNISKDEMELALNRIEKIYLSRV